jgi:hypothetical protein
MKREIGRHIALFEIRMGRLLRLRKKARGRHRTHGDDR